MNQHFRSGPRPSSDPEHLTFDGAQKLAARLREYWAERGKSPLITVAREEGVRMKSARAWDPAFVADKEHPGIYVIRSNIINGWPT